MFTNIMIMRVKDHAWNIGFRGWLALCWLVTQQHDVMIDDDVRLINLKGDIDFLAGGCWRTKNQVKKF